MIHDQKHLKNIFSKEHPCFSEYNVEEILNIYFNGIEVSATKLACLR